jgi:predicted dienelactone hydrolase
MTDPEMFVGSRQLRIQDEDKGLSFPALVLYPTHVPSSPTAFGPYSMDVSPDAPAAEGQYPLIIISHGTGGSHLVYRTIGTHLAKNGYVVAMLEHPGNNRNNNELEGTHENLVNRPRHVRLTMDAVSSDADLGGSVQPDNVGIIGHSMGAYTALAVAGGTPWSETRQRVEVVPDGSLRNVTVPILILSAEHDPYTPGWNAELVLAGVVDSARVTHRVIENAGHFSFLSPFPPQMRNAGFLPSTDPEGFDREEFHQWLPGEVLGFFDESLRNPRA